MTLDELAKSEAECRKFADLLNTRESITRFQRDVASWKGVSSICVETYANAATAGTERYVNCRFYLCDSSKEYALKLAEVELQKIDRMISEMPFPIKAREGCPS